MKPQQRIESVMGEVDKVLERYNIQNPAKNEIYNRCYEAVAEAINNTLDEVFKIQGIKEDLKSDDKLSKLLIQPNGKTVMQEIWERIIKEQSDKIRGSL